MGSQAQDARHEQKLQNLRNAIIELDRQVKAKKNELHELMKELEEAKQALEIQESIDLERD